MKLKKVDYAIAAVIVIIVAAFAVLQPSYPAESAAAPQDVITCEDSDGTDISTKGTVTHTINGVQSTYTDECTGSILKEFTCNGNRVASRLQKCSCNDGRCV
ncbi:MAG: hypothetical protein HYW27_03120 [Candidatus Aenigmarchaeota archaeon]|nr:hypothetical protein [Candidatus Aenigmarchaeota archaeon]